MFLISFVVEMEPLLRVNAFSRGSNSWRIFTYKELHAATNGFNEENKLGEGLEVFIGEKPMMIFR